MADGQQEQATFQSPTTGKVQPVDQDQWEEALGKGYKPVSHKVMYSTGGQRAMVPNEQMRDYMKKGYQTTKPTPAEVLPEKGVWQTAKEDILAPFHNPAEQQPAIHALPSSQIGRALEEMPYQTADERARQGFIRRQNAGHGLPYSLAATALEYATPTNVGGMEEAAEAGHPSEVYGHALGGAIQVAAPEAVSQAVPHLPGAVRAIRNADIPGRIGEALRTPGTLENPKGALKPAVRTAARVAGGMAGHAILPGVGTTLGGAYVGPGVADIIIPAHPNPRGWTGRVPTRMPRPTEAPSPIPAGATISRGAPAAGEVLPTPIGEARPMPRVMSQAEWRQATEKPAPSPFAGATSSGSPIGGAILPEARGEPTRMPTVRTRAEAVAEGKPRIQVTGIEGRTAAEGGPGAVESEGRPATWSDDAVLDLASKGNRAAISQIGARRLDKKFAGDPRLENIRYVMGDIDYRNLVTSPREVTRFTPEGQPIRQEVPGPMGRSEDVAARAVRQGRQPSPPPKTERPQPAPVNRGLTLGLEGETPLGGELTPQQERRSLIGTSPTGTERRGQALRDWQNAIETTPPGERTPGELLGEEIRGARGAGQAMYPAEVPKTGNIVEDVKNALAYEEKTNGHNTAKAEKLRDYLETAGERTNAEEQPAAEEPEAVETEVKGITAKEPKAKRLKAELPDVERMYSQEEIIDAEGLINQEVGMMQAGERPGRYFDESEAGDVRLRSRGSQFKGGDWRGVTSGREMQPFLREHPDWSPTALAKAMRNKDSAMYKKAVDAAAKWIRQQNETAEAAERGGVQSEEGVGGAILPGFEEAVREQAAGAAQVKGEELTRQMNEPKSIEAQAGRMEQLSPLFRGTEASPQREIFGQEITPPPEPRAVGETYWKGDRAEYTGNTNEIAGGKFYEIRLLEGHLKGQTKWTPKPPGQ